MLTYAEMLIGTYHPDLANAMFTFTGSETSDLALRVARNFTGGTCIIVTETAYHGITSAVSEISPSLGEHVPLGQHVRTVPAPDPLRGEGADVGETFASNVQHAIDDLKRHGVKVAALIVDTIFSSDGVYA